MEDLMTVLLDIERRAWSAADLRDVEFYREYLASEALAISPWGVLDREGILRDIAQNPHELPKYSIANPRVVPLGEAGAVLAYIISAGEQRFFVSTVYMRSGDRWRAALHQRTPVSPDVGAID